MALTDHGLVETDIAISDGRIADLGKSLRDREARVIDGSGMIIGPGFVDLHVHLREPGQTWKEDIASGSAAAAAGGFTAVVAMPNTDPAIDSVAALDLASRSASRSPIQVVFAGAITEGRKGLAMSHLDDLYDAGVRIFSDDGDSVSDAGLLRSVMTYLGDRPDVVIAQHAEDAALSANGHMHEGRVAFGFGLRGVPRSAEEVVIARDLLLAAESGSRYHAQHLSTRRSVEMIRMAKRAGVSVTAEVTPHHLSLTEGDVDGLDANLKMYPPLRTEEDRQALIAGLKDGTIDAIATDHAPHTAEEKDTGFEAAPRGVIGLETAFPLALRALEGDIELLFQRMSIGPSAIAGLSEQGQPLAVGNPANLVLVDPDVDWTPAEFASKSTNSPFVGRKLRGRVMTTISRGHVVFEGRK